LSFISFVEVGLRDSVGKCGEIAIAGVQFGIAGLKTAFVVLFVLEMGAEPEAATAAIGSVPGEGVSDGKVHGII
jgi:hypothetical protein